MPIAKLFVEGDLEIQSLNPILLGNPVLQQGGSKNALKARAGTERRENLVPAGYLRDRDFDFDPPADLMKPTLDSNFGGTTDPLGWRWCRHEIENYLIDPALVGEATGWDIDEFKVAIRDAAARIRDYEVARWAIGIVRRALPPQFELRTRPDGLNEIALPASLGAADVHSWASNSIAAHRAPMVAATDPAAIQKTFDDLTAKFDNAFLADTARVLIWFSGKDLLAALSDWLVARGVANPGAFRADYCATGSSPIPHARYSFYRNGTAWSKQSERSTVTAASAIGHADFGIGGVDSRMGHAGDGKGDETGRGTVLLSTATSEWGAIASRHRIITARA